MTRAWLALLAVLFVGGLARATALSWVCDDAFISLRYAENLLAGLGLVYNAGEFVEGYSNLLWTLLLAGLMRLGMPPLRAAELPGLVCYAALALSLVTWSWRQARRGERVFLPLAAALVLISHDFHVWATGGLETMLFTALAVQALLLTRLPRPGMQRALAAGVLLGLLALARLDGVLIAGAAAASWWIPLDRLERRLRLRLGLATLAPLALVLVALIPWKLAYYGELLPTAFYSKSVLRPYPSQGAAYLGLYLAANWFLLAAAVAALAAALHSRGRSPLPGRWDDRFFLGAAALYTAYVVAVGGDFMFARRLVPVAPLVFLALENRVARWPAPRFRTALAATLLLAAAFPVPLLGPAERIRNIGDEHSFYPPEVVEMRRRQASAVSAALAHTPARVAFEGGMCMFGYYSRLPYLVEITGLTQYSLARRPLQQRGFIGHEKVADSAWLTQNGIHLVVNQREPPVAPREGVLELDALYFGDLARARIHIYSDAVMDPLRGRDDVSFVPIERAVELSRARMERAAPREAERIYAELQRYYFDTAGARGEAWQRALREVLARKRQE